MKYIKVGVICTHIGVDAFGKHEECVRGERAGHLAVKRITKRGVRI